MAWLRWFVCSVSFAAIALLPHGDARTYDSSCPTGDTIAHPQDCRKYLQCMEREQLVLLTCDEEMYYDAEAATCTFKQPPNCSQRKDDTELLGAIYEGRSVVDPCNGYRPGFKVPHPGDCSMFFQCTQYGAAALFRCPANLLFHAAMKVCVWPQQVVCESGAVRPPPPQPPTPLPPPISTTADLLDVCEPSCFLDFRCPVNCDPILPPTLFQHPSRCDAFFQCNAYGYSCEIECPAGMWFSYLHQRCVYAGLSDCTPVTRPPCVNPVCRPHPDCPEEDTDPPTKLPIEGNPYMYYICRNGYACEIPCPPGLQWDIDTRQCEFTDPDDPSTPPSPETTTTTAPVTTTTTAPVTTTTTAPVTTTTTAPVTTTTTAPVTTTTTAPVTTTTTAPVTTTTTAPETTTTAITTTTESECPTCAPSNCVPDSRCPACEACMPTYFPHEDCDKFYKCNFGLICEMNCPPGLHFNTRENVCDWPWAAGCDSPPITDPPAGNAVCHPHSSCPRDDAIDVFLPHPNCGLYYKCTWGNACLKECPDGLHWSVTKERCEWPFLAGCDLDIPPNDPNCPTCPCIPCRTNQNACHPSGRCPPSAMTNATMSFRHEHHCDQFYECLSGQACVLECPSGLEYSGGAGRCDEPSYAMCSVG